MSLERGSDTWIEEVSAIESEKSRLKAEQETEKFSIEDVKKQLDESLKNRRERVIMEVHAKGKNTPY